MEKGMTIKEVENELGIPRATIRFYEKNGLINPSRGENSYRFYSDEDVAELRRIIILRKIGISVEEISAILRGDFDLNNALTSNLEKLDVQLRELTGAINMCRKLKSEGVHLVELSQVTYWNDIEEEEKKGNLFMNIAEDLYIVAKHRFLSNFGIEDCEGNATTDTKGIIKTVFIQCLVCGIFISIIDTIIKHKNFSIDTFREWFIWPIVMVIVGFFVEIPFYFIGKKHPGLARKRKKIGFWVVAILIIGMIVLALLGYFLDNETIWNIS